MARKRKLAVVAVGGNSLIVDKDHQSIHDQSDAAAVTARHVVDMVEAGWNVVLTHGSGPQVGFILRRSELALKEVPPVPMDYAGADLQGAIGYMFQRAFHNEFRRRKLDNRAIALVTQVLVDRDDPAFEAPNKPVGSYMSEDHAHELAHQQGWTVMEDAGRGWRRVVPSPEPRRIVDLAPIEQLVRMDYLVIACGGGGIPVVEDKDGNLRGLEAVIDKDLASSVLATALGADLLAISTSVEKVAISFNTPDERWLDRMTLAEARRFDRQGHFAAGSMAPKIRAVVRYLEAGGARALITDPPNLGRALAGKAGTEILPD